VYKSVKFFTNGKNNDSVRRDCPRGVGSSGLCQGLEGRRDCHGRRVDEGEEQNVSALLLIRKQFRIPVCVAAEAGEIIGQKQVESEHLYMSFL